MKCQAPTQRSDAEILEILESATTKPDDRVGAVLSAVFYGSTLEFAGDALINEFAEAQYKERTYLKNLFVTFYQSCSTTYRIDESIDSLKTYKAECPNEAPEIEGVIEALAEFKVMFGNA